VSWVVLSIALLATTLGAPGIEGVRRWHSMGPLQLHVSALAAPTLIVLAASATTTRSLLALALLGVLQVIHIAQPDAGQATAVAAAALYLAGCSLRGTQRVGVTSLHLACLVAAWRRPDPLQPVTFVEDIVSRAFLLGPAPGLAAIVALVAYVAAPLMASPRPTREGIALSAYCAGAVAATSCGAFPVPLLGFGVSPVVGALLGLAMIDRTTHETTLSSHTKLRRIPRE
jgi:cell division protein FtsW (lipid II flippase)